TPDPEPTAGPCDASPLGDLVGSPTRRAQHEVPGADVADLAPAEPGLEVGDPARGEAPEVVARRALLARGPDRLPFQEVVGPCPPACRGHPAVRLDHARPAADEE